MRGYVDTVDGQVHYRREGEGLAQALVLLHESPLSSEIFARCLPLLGAEIDAIALDAPGYGLSDPSPSPPTIESYAATLLEAISGLGLERFALFGTHTGVSVALELAHLAGLARVTHGILSGVPLLSADERARLLAQIVADFSPRADGSHLGRAWANRSQAGGDGPDLITLGVLHLAGNHELCHLGHHAVFAHDCAPLLPGFTPPTLVLNSEDDPLAAKDPVAVGLLPDARLVMLPRGNRKPYFQSPELFSREVLAFLRERPAGPVAAGGGLGGPG